MQPFRGAGVRTTDCLISGPHPKISEEAAFSASFWQFNSVLVLYPVLLVTIYSLYCFADGWWLLQHFLSFPVRRFQCDNHKLLSFLARCVSSRSFRKYVCFGLKIPCVTPGTCRGTGSCWGTVCPTACVCWFDVRSFPWRRPRGCWWQGNLTRCETAVAMRCWTLESQCRSDDWSSMCIGVCEWEHAH